MDAILIRGGGPLRGKIQVSGAKNAALPILCATLLSDGASRLRNVPALRDIDTTAALLRFLGRDVTVAAPEVHVASGSDVRPEAPYELVKQMRASVLVLGPLVARFGRAKVSLPGGCQIGARPIDQHLKGLEALGCTIRLERGYVIAEGPGQEADCAEAEALFRHTDGHRHREPDDGVESCARQGRTRHGQRGAGARGSKSSGECSTRWERRSTVRGLDDHPHQGLGAGRPGAPFDHAIIPDRIEAPVAHTWSQRRWPRAATSSSRKAREISDLEALIVKMRAAGVDVSTEGQSLRVHRRGPLRAVNVTTAPHPGFPTDMQAQFLVLMSLARGESVITETASSKIAFQHVPELQRMGARHSSSARTHRRGPGRRAAERRQRHGNGSPCERVTRRCGPRRVRRDGGPPRVPYRPRVRAYRREARRRGCPHRARARSRGVSDLLTMALPKGRVLRAVAPLLERAGVDTAALLAGGDDRSLIREAPAAGLRFLLLKPDDVPTYVEYGAADVGICGRDVLMEKASDLYRSRSTSASAAATHGGRGGCRAGSRRAECLALRPSIPGVLRSTLPGVACKLTS